MVRHLALARKTLRAVPALLALTAGCGREPTRPVAFVANAGSNQVQVIDLDSGRTVGMVHSGAGPWRLAVSPAQTSLWVQHWNSGTTAVIDLKSLQVLQTLPFRGPGIFSAAGDRFLTFSWPDYALAELDARDGHVLDRQVTEVGKVADLANASSGQLYLLQRNLLSEEEGPRYSYVLAYEAQEGADAAPRTLRTGLDPEDILAIPGQPFVLTADRGTDGISFFNSAGDRRTLQVCSAPRRLALSGDGLMLAVGCWQADTGAAGEIVLFSADFSTRPWPEIRERARAPFTALSALLFSRDGRWLYGLDETAGRLVEMSAGDLSRHREIALGSKPRDLAIVPLPLSVVDSWAKGDDPDSALTQALRRNRSWGASFDTLAWTEVISWRETRGEDKAESPPDPASWEIAKFLSGTGAMRSASASGCRISDAGWSYTIREDGRFWRAPQLELLARVLALPNLPADAAIRLMAGDFPGAPFPSGGISADVFVQRQTVDGPVLIWGASGPDEPVSQLWIDATTGAPLRLIERLPLISASAHASGDVAGTIDTRFLEWRTLPGGAKLPARLERVIDGGRVQDVEFVEGRSEKRPDGFFDLVQLGGVLPGRDQLPASPKSMDVKTPAIMSGDYLQTPWAPHPPYSTNPATSGPRLRSLADWGVHRYPVPPELLVHNLEHGAVVVQYNCPRPCGELRERLEALGRSGRPVIVAPSPYLGSRLALTAWGRLLTLDDWDEQRIDQFMENHAGIDHHQAP